VERDDDGVLGHSVFIIAENSSQFCNQFSVLGSQLVIPVFAENWELRTFLSALFFELQARLVFFQEFFDVICCA